jgi:hypothetical protein
MLIGDAAALPLGVPGSSWTPVEGLPDLFAWPFDPSILWFRLVDLLALVTVVLWLGRRLRERFLVIGVRLRLADTVPAVAGLIASGPSRRSGSPRAAPTCCSCSCGSRHAARR